MWMTTWQQVHARHTTPHLRKDERTCTNSTMCWKCCSQWARSPMRCVHGGNWPVGGHYSVYSNQGLQEWKINVSNSILGYCKKVRNLNWQMFRQHMWYDCWLVNIWQKKKKSFLILTWKKTKTHTNSLISFTFHQFLYSKINSTTWPSEILQHCIVHVNQVQHVSGIVCTYVLHAYSGKVVELGEAKINEAIDNESWFARMLCI